MKTNATGSHDKIDEGKPTAEETIGVVPSSAAKPPHSGCTRWYQPLAQPVEETGPTGRVELAVAPVNNRWTRQAASCLSREVVTTYPTEREKRHETKRSRKSSRPDWPPPSMVPLGLVPKARQPTYIVKADVRSVIISSGPDADSSELCAYLLKRWERVWTNVIDSWRMSKTMRGSGEVRDPYFYPPGVQYSDRIRSKRRLRWVLEHMVQHETRDYDEAVKALDAEAQLRGIGPITGYIPRQSLDVLHKTGSV